MKAAGLLLAAGLSRRFGPANKLLANVRGLPLVSYAARTMAQLEMPYRYAVTADPAVADCLDGYDIVTVSPGPRTMAQNIAAGVDAARRAGADCVLIALGDMPNVSLAHFEALLGKCTSTMASASSDGANRMPPACFPAVYFDRLLSLNGESGASHIIQKLPDTAIVCANKSDLRDIDFAEDLQPGSTEGLQILK